MTTAPDAAGNRVSLARTSGAATNLPAAVLAAYDAANEQITFNSLPASFDANGNQTTSTDASGTTTYTWDARNRLVAISGPGISGSFVYDALGRRISKTIGGTTTQFLYDGNDIEQEIGGSAVGASYVRSLSIDEPFVRQASSGNEFYHVDALGSTLNLTNQTGAVQTSYYYEAFGKTTSTGMSSNAVQYKGRENDGMSLFYNRSRYYSPVFHRFVSEDSLEFEAGDTDLYAYTSNDPINNTDPTGEFPPLLLLCLRGAVTSVTQDIVSGRKVDFSDAAISCLTGGFGKAVKVGSVLSAVKSGNKIPRVKPTMPQVKPGAAGGPTAGKLFPNSVKRQAKADDPTATCVYCGRAGTGTQVDHAIPRARGGNATIANAQLACPHCNPSKGARDAPVTPPPGYIGPWPRK